METLSAFAEKILNQNGFMAFMFTVLSVCVGIALAWIGKWYFNREAERDKRNELREDKYMAFIDNFNNRLAEHTEQAKVFHDTQTTANQAQRTEHKDILERQGQIHDYLVEVKAKLNG